MAEITLPYDLKDVKTNEDSEVIPKALWLCEVVRGTYMEAKDDKSAQIALTIKVIEAEKPENAGYVGAQWVEYLSLLPSVSWKMKQFLCGLYGREVEGKKVDPVKWQGKKLAIRTMIDNYGGVEKTKADRFMAVAKFRKPQLPGEEPDPMAEPTPPPTANGTSRAATPPPAPPAADDDVSI